MLKEAINAITQAEAQARQTVAAAEEQAEQLVADTRAAGELVLANAARKAEEKLAQLDRQIDERSRAYVYEQDAENEQKLEALRRRAGYRMERAAALIVERIEEG